MASADLTPNAAALFDLGKVFVGGIIGFASALAAGWLAEKRAQDRRHLEALRIFCLKTLKIGSWSFRLERHIGRARAAATADGNPLWHSLLPIAGGPPAPVKFAEVELVEIAALKDSSLVNDAMFLDEEFNEVVAILAEYGKLREELWSKLPFAHFRPDGGGYIDASKIGPLTGELKTVEGLAEIAAGKIARLSHKAEGLLERLRATGIITRSEEESAAGIRGAGVE